MVGYFDDYNNYTTSQNGLPILGNTDSVYNLFKKKLFDELIIAVGYNHMKFRKNIFDEFSKKIPFANIIHPSCSIDKSASLGTGIFMLPGCIIDTNVKIGDNVLLNLGSVVSHDTNIGSHCFLSPRVAVAGKVYIKHSCVIGINATIIDNIIIESNSKIAGGAVVISNITKPGMYAGVPAKWKKEI